MLLVMGISSAMLVATAQVADAQAPCASASAASCWFAPRPAPSAPAPAVAPAPAPAPPAVPATVAAPAPARPTVTQAVPEAARLLLELANRDRAAAGLGRLTQRDDIVAIALEHSYRMAAAGDIFHNDNFFTGLVRTLLNSLVRGENVAQNMSVEDTHRRLMNSPGHRANLLDPRFSTVGFAVVQSPSGQYWSTQDFIQPAGAAAPTPTSPATAAPTTAPKTPVKIVAARPQPAANVAVPVVATTTTAPPAPEPVSVELNSAVLAMQEPLAIAAVTTSSAPGTGDGGPPLAGVGVVLTVVLGAGAVGMWRLRRSMTDR